VLDCDIKGFFENINHEKMIKLLELKIHDRAFIRLIHKWLKSGILERDGNIISPYTGCPQGGVISPILSNVYLHYALDRWFVHQVKPCCKGETVMVRYADDFVCAFQYYEDAQKFQEWLHARLKKFNLELSEEKTRLIKFNRHEIRQSKSFDFLGFEYRWQRHKWKKYPFLAIQTSSKILQLLWNIR
jgi:retron-type reverse transcriptase